VEGASLGSPVDRCGECGGLSVQRGEQSSFAAVVVVAVGTVDPVVIGTDPLAFSSVPGVDAAVADGPSLALGPGVYGHHAHLGNRAHV
jgi:hypothetical protein